MAVKRISTSRFLSRIFVLRFIVEPAPLFRALDSSYCKDGLFYGETTRHSDFLSQSILRCGKQNVPKIGFHKRSVLSYLADLVIVSKQRLLDVILTSYLRQPDF